MTFECLKAIATEAGGFENIVGMIFHDSVIYVKEFLNDPLKESDFKKLGNTWCFVEKLTYRDRRTYEYDVPAVDYHDLDFLMHVITMKDADRRRVDIAGINDMHK